MPKNPDSEIIDLLNEVLTAELTAINQYFLHAEMCNNWGYTRLYSFLRKESIDEMKHAEEMLERVLYLGGLPNVQRLFPIRIGETVPEIFKSDMALEVEAIDRLNKGIPMLREKGDAGSAVILEGILTSEEEHLDWIEAQQDQIEQMGLENYLSTLVGDA
jgi:bacterioferritin